MRSGCPRRFVAGVGVTGDLRTYRPDGVLRRNVQSRENNHMSIIAWLIVGAIAGFLAGYLVKGDEGLGVIGHIVLGIVGALVGGFLAGILTGQDYTTGINISTIIVAVIGAVIVVVVANMIRGGSRSGRGAVCPPHHLRDAAASQAFGPAAPPFRFRAGSLRGRLEGDPD